MAEGSKYDEWIAHRRAVEPSPGLTDRILAAVENRHVHRESHVRLADRVNESVFARWTACMAALLVGLLPFVFAAYVAELIVF